MNDNLPDEDKIRAALTSAASINQSLRRPRFNQLIRYQEQIRQLRGQGASFSTIEKLLKKNALHVSHETIRIFYREVVEQKPFKRKQRRRKSTVKKQILQSKVAALPKTRNIGEPRIARIEDL